MPNCEICDERFDPEVIDYPGLGIPGGETLCFDCVINCCSLCFDHEPGGLYDETLQMCQMCVEHVMGEDYDPED
jgi:hypothetical protein